MAVAARATCGPPGAGQDPERKRSTPGSHLLTGVGGTGVRAPEGGSPRRRPAKPGGPGPAAAPLPRPLLPAQGVAAPEARARRAGTGTAVPAAPPPAGGASIIDGGSARAAQTRSPPG